MPLAYGRLTGLGGFLAALEMFGTGDWARVFDVAETPEQVSVRRPFYPRASGGPARHAHLLRGLRVDGIADLLRRCDHATETRRAASPLFWTLGPSQVGKAAISGWREVIVPARRRGAAVWPFDGGLRTLAAAGAPVLAETYPAEAYAHAGLRFTRRMSKRRWDDRRAALAGLAEWTRARGIVVSPELAEQVDQGFGARPDGEDAFDALAGVLGMIEVADGRRPDRPAAWDSRDVWEGWILGQVG